MKTIISTAHQAHISGKCSPDGEFKEYEYSRKLCKTICKKLNSLGYESHIDIIDDDLNMSQSEELRYRCRIINGHHSADKNTIAVSVHCNAAGQSGWSNASGLTVHVCNNCSKNSERLAQCIYKQASVNNLQGNRYVPRDYLWRNDFYILKHTTCPCVLVETAFMTNKDDLTMMCSDEGFERIVSTIVEGIRNYWDS